MRLQNDIDHPVKKCILLILLKSSFSSTGLEKAGVLHIIKFEDSCRGEFAALQHFEDFSNEEMFLMLKNINWNVELNLHLVTKRPRNG